MYVKEQKKKDEETKKLTEEIKKNQELLLQHIAALSKKKKSKKKGIGKASLRPRNTEDPNASTSSTGIMQNIRNVFSGSQTNLEQTETLGTETGKEDDKEDDNHSHHSGTSHSSFSIIPEDPILPRMRRPPPPPSPTLPPPSPTPTETDFGLTAATTKKIFITKCSLKLQNNEIDHLYSTQTTDQAINDYYRLYLTNGLANSLQSSYINYQTFMNGCFISAWDLSTSGSVGNSYALPNIKTGIYKDNSQHKLNNNDHKEIKF